MTSKRNLILSVFCLLAAIGCWAKNSVAPITPGNVFLKMGDTETVVPLKLTNWGDTEVSSISYTFYYTDKQVSEGPFVLNFDQPLKDGETREVKIPIKPGPKLGKEEVLFNITQVNGKPTPGIYIVNGKKTVIR